MSGELFTKWLKLNAFKTVLFSVIAIIFMVIFLVMVFGALRSYNKDQNN